MKCKFLTRRPSSLWTNSRPIVQEMSNEDNSVLVVFLPATTTDRLKPLDLSINKATKDFLRDKFRRWYAQQISKSPEWSRKWAGHASWDHEGAIYMSSMAVALYNHVCCNPDLVVNGFKEAGITDALENGIATPPFHEGPSSDDDESEDPFFDIHSDSFWFISVPLPVCYLFHYCTFVSFSNPQYLNCKSNPIWYKQINNY